MRVGEIVEDFELPDESGEMRTLSGLLRDGTVVLFFFPAALQPMCVREACRFRDMAEEFARFGAQPVGISGDSVRRQQHFVNAHSLGYPLLSDKDGSVRETFHVIRGFAPDFAPRFARFRRNTFIIGEDRRVLDVIRSDLRPGVHADLALDFLRRRTTTGA